MTGCISTNDRTGTNSVNHAADGLVRILATLIGWLAFSPALAREPVHSDAADGTKTARPNVVWFMSEDNSKHYLRHFDPSGAPAPNIESLAAHGITFDRAFSNAPVCSVARTTLITSCYGPRIGTQFHRRIELAAMPPGVSMFPALLRQAGYYTTNNRKEDYNAVKGDDVWDESSAKASWTNRPTPETPFFHVVTDTASHESSLHFPAKDTREPTKTDRNSVDLQPYFPDTPLFRYTVARYHDRMMAIDRAVGKLVGQLRDAGELDNTFIFYFGDHGGVLPRSKGYAYESGLHVPLVVRVPKNFARLIDRPIGSRTEGFVEFVDFGPTVLNLAQVDAPEGIDGNAFLGPGIQADQVDGRDEAFGYADRFDEKYDLVRTLRQGDWKYIRNFEPFYPDAMQNNYRYKMAAYGQWRQRHDQGTLSPVQDQFFQPKAPEALYDLANDPHETHNLAGEPAQADRLVRMRERLNARLVAMPDTSFVTEAALAEVVGDDAVAFGQEHRDEIKTLIETANLALLPFDQAEPSLRKAIASDNPMIRYWALVAATSFGPQSRLLAADVRPRLVDVEPMVSVRAAEWMAVAVGQDPRPTLYRSIARATSEAEALRMLNTAVFLSDHTGGRFPIDAGEFHFLFSFTKKSELSRRLEYLRP